MQEPKPPRPAQELSWRARLASLRNIRPLLRMVWETSPPLVVASTVFRLFRALLPLAMLWVSKLIIDGVVAWITRRGGILAGIWKLVALELAPAMFWDAPTPCVTACWATAWCGAARYPGAAPDPPGIRIPPRGLRLQGQRPHGDPKH